MDAREKTTDFPDLLSELRWRGLLHQATDEGALAEHFATGTRKVYCGFDPTADSLTIGNLVPMMLLKHVQRHGHTPIVLMGGATGRIGDPSGKSAERTLMSDDDIRRNLTGQRPIFDRVLGAGVKIVDNYSWWKDMSFLDVLRDIGKHFSVNVMMQKDSVKSRLESREQGISFTEFSYQILQGYDFLHLAREEGVTVQCGGSDQWGNIIAGTDLVARTWQTSMSEIYDDQEAISNLRSIIDIINQDAPDTPVSRAFFENALRRARFKLSADEFVASHVSNPDMIVDHLNLQSALLQQRMEQMGWTARAFAFTAPLVTKADGGKFGKSEAGAVWLSGPRTTPYAFHQFWLNTADADVERFLKMFTLLSRAEIESLVEQHNAAPERRVAQRALADNVTAIVHGKDAVERANAAASALFSGEVANLDRDTLHEVFATVPSTWHDSIVFEPPGWSVIDALVATNLATSKSQAKQFVSDGAVTINGQIKATLETRLTTAHLLDNSIMLLRRGKKNWHMCRFGAKR
jgi:tyrosyl-tRNA synthetase